MKVLITGAAGFVGKSVVRVVRLKGHEVVRVVRVYEPDAVAVDALQGIVDWSAAFIGCDVVIHLAARVHVMNDAVQDSLAEFRATNVDLTVNLAKQAARAGVRRFIFISSIKVNGEATASDRPFTAADTPQPQDPYGVSKMEAEQALVAIAVETGLEVVIIRPPLVYGPEVRANFGALLRAVAHGVPLPLGAIHNRRSLVALDNLVDFIVTCMDHPRAAGQVWMVSDGEDLSTPELIRRMARAMGRSASIINLPVWLLEMLGKLTGKSSAIERLCGNLQVDISKTEAVLGWRPPVGVDEGLRRAAVQWRK